MDRRDYYFSVNGPFNKETLIFFDQAIVLLGTYSTYIIIQV